MPPLFILPGGYIPDLVFLTGIGRHGEIGKYRASVGSGSVALWADTHQPFLLFAPAASGEKSGGFVYQWRLWNFLCAIFFPPSFFRKLVVRESPLGMSSELEGLLT